MGLGMVVQEVGIRGVLMEVDEDADGDGKQGPNGASMSCWSWGTNFLGSGTTRSISRLVWTALSLLGIHHWIFWALRPAFVLLG